MAVTTSQLQTEIAQVRLDLATINQKLDALSGSSIELTETKGEVNSINTRLSSIEQLILDNPAKALSLTLIEKDLDNIEQRQQ
ncbi:MAG: hypothetical protein ACT4QE_20740, partial [Anaerolineales bacterium]